MNVARMAGVEERILDKAEEMARLMKQEIRKKRDAQVEAEFMAKIQEFSIV